MPGKPRKPERSSTRKKEKDAAWQKKQKRKICIFCKDHIDYVDYKDVIMLRKFVSERGKIRARRVTGTVSSTSVTSRRPSRTPARWPCSPTEQYDE